MFDVSAEKSKFEFWLTFQSIFDSTSFAEQQFVNHLVTLLGQ